MTFGQAIILGIIEGLTEFLPVSSTFHLIMAGKWLGLTNNELTKLFDVFIQMGAILAVVWLYAKEVWRRKDWWRRIMLSFIPTGLIGWALHGVIKGTFFESEGLMLSVFIIIGGLFIGYERGFRRKRSDLTISMMKNSQAVLIGLAQALAIVPGVSRSGAVILAMLVLGYSRTEAAKYSFLLAVPTLFIAGFYDLMKSGGGVVNLEEGLLLFIGLVSAGLTAFMVLKTFMGIISKYSFEGFGWYRLVVGVILAGWLFL